MPEIPKPEPVKRKQRIIMPGDRFGKLVVVDPAYDRRGPVHGGAWFILARCDCGKSCTMRRTDLFGRRARTSCGCLRRPPATVHTKMGFRLHDSPIYRIWAGMRDRCSNPKNARYARYGGRGIKICRAWQTDFGVFLTWALGAGYQEGLSIERINNDGNYTPKNCTWIPRAQQARNTSMNRRLTAWGETRLISDWIGSGDPRVKINNLATLSGRLSREWTPEEALSTPPVSFSEAGRRGAAKRAKQEVM